jgi:hypothetical protein
LKRRPPVRVVRRDDCSYSLDVLKQNHYWSIASVEVWGGHDSKTGVESNHHAVEIFTLLRQTVLVKPFDPCWPVAFAESYDLIFAKAASARFEIYRSQRGESLGQVPPVANAHGAAIGQRNCLVERHLGLTQQHFGGVLMGFSVKIPK